MCSLPVLLHFFYCIIKGRENALVICVHFTKTSVFLMMKAMLPVSFRPAADHETSTSDIKYRSRKDANSARCQVLLLVDLSCTAAFTGPSLAPVSPRPAAVSLTSPSTVWSPLVRGVPCAPRFRGRFERERRLPRSGFSAVWCSRSPQQAEPVWDNGQELLQGESNGADEDGDARDATTKVQDAKDRLSAALDGADRGAARVFKPILNGCGWAR